MKAMIGKKVIAAGMAAVVVAGGWLSGVEVKGGEIGVAPAFILTEPLFKSWKLNTTDRIAQIREEDGGATTTSWMAIQGWDPPPEVPFDPAKDNILIEDALADVTEVHYHGGFVYIGCAGLASYTMGPWHQPLNLLNGYFEFRPIDRWTASGLFWNGIDVTTEPYVRIPLSSEEMARGEEYPVELGDVAVWVNGTSVYAPMAGFYWNGTENVMGQGYWNLDAYWEESETFDIAGFHQDGAQGPTWGKHHSHINPLGLRCQLGDHVRAIFKNQQLVGYGHMSFLQKHSPILGWAYDGYPIYGPYGYSDPWDTNSGVRIMESGYVLRADRDGLPEWAKYVQAARGTMPAGASITGPDVTTYPMGAYVEDYEYLGDIIGDYFHPGPIAMLTSSPVPDWDLDRSNGRWCYTPEFPNGTYAYFVTVDPASPLKPVFPYVLGPMYKGNPAGGEVEEIPAGAFKYYSLE